jgi:putative flippase GtrA
MFQRWQYSRANSTSRCTNLSGLFVLSTVAVISTVRALLHYLVTGGAAAAIDMAGFALLSWVGLPIVLAASCSFAVATVVNFLLTSRWVFRAKPTGQRYVVFLTGALLALLVNVSLTFVGVRHLMLPPTAAKTCAIGVTFLLNFWINARIVFRNEPPCGSAESTCRSSRSPANGSNSVLTQESFDGPSRRRRRLCSHARD